MDNKHGNIESLSPEKMKTNQTAPYSDHCQTFIPELFPKLIISSNSGKKRRAEIAKGFEEIVSIGSPPNPRR